MSFELTPDNSTVPHCALHPHFIMPCIRCAQEAKARGEAPKQERHRWVKPEIHHYVCGKCGIEKINIEEDRSYWVQEYRMPDGTVQRFDKVPPCAPGKLTDERLKKYANVIADQIQPRKGRKKKDADDDGWEPPF